MGRLRRARMPMGRLGWALALVSTALSTVGPASAQSPTLPLEGDLSVQNHKMCVNINDDVVKVCKATDSETQALCSSACETAIRTALAHQECFNVIITTRSAPMTYEQSVQSHVNFHAYNCLPDEPAADAVSHAPGARRNALRARPLDPKVANECFVHEDRSDYRGFVNTTLSGYTCQKWSEQFPHHHPHAPSESNAWQGLGDHNYCRALSWDSCAWCYTTVHTPKWECCLIGSPQPSCPKKAFMPATDEISERERKVLDELTAGNCPRMLIMMKLAPTSAHLAGKSGWYEVVSESSAGLDGRESYQLSGHHLTLPGTVKETVLGRSNAKDGVFRCTHEGLFFEPTDAAAAASAGGGRIRIYGPSVPQLNASILQLIEFKPEDNDGEDAVPVKERLPLPWWRHLSMKTYIYGGLGLYVGSMALCAVLAFLVAKGGRSMGKASLQSPRSPGWGKAGKGFRATGHAQPAAPQPASWREEPSYSLPASAHQATVAGGGPAPMHLQPMGAEAAGSMRRVHNLAAATIQQRARERNGKGGGHDAGAYANGHAPGYAANGHGANGYANGHAGNGYGGSGYAGNGYGAPYGNGAYLEHAHAGGYDDDVSFKRGGGAGYPPHSPGGMPPYGEGPAHAAAASKEHTGCKHFMVPFFRRLGTVVARNPWRTIGFSCVFALCLTAGLVRMRFEADSSVLFLPQRTDMAHMRSRYAETFGSLPDVIMMVVKKRAGGSMINRASLTSATQLYKQVITLDALPKSTCPDDPTGRAVCGAHADPIELNEFCVSWYVAQLGDYVCSVDSILELWKYEFGPINSDPDPEHTLYKAYKERRVELGLASVDDASQRVTTDAFMISFYLNTSSPAYSNGRYAIWHNKLRESLNLIAQREALEVSWWSTRLNEDEAGSFVQKDAPLLAFSFIFVILYVTITLSRISCSEGHPHPQQLAMGDDGALGYAASTGGGSNVRIMVSLSCALCSALSMSSGFGLTALFGVPISPVSPLVSFMLLGVSVDNMIIIVDTFDRIDENEDIDVRLSMSLSESGTAITVTTFTTFVAFITGLWVDLPVYAYFCTTAACCTGCLYVLQLTLFSALLVIDTQGRDSASHSYDEAMFEDSAYAYEAAYGRGARGYAEGSFASPAHNGGGALLPQGHVGSEHAGYAQQYGGPAQRYGVHPPPAEEPVFAERGGGRGEYADGGYGGDVGGGYGAYGPGDEPSPPQQPTGAGFGPQEPIPSGYGDLYDYGTEYGQPLYGSGKQQARGGGGQPLRSAGGPAAALNGGGGGGGYPQNGYGAPLSQNGQRRSTDEQEFYPPPPPNGGYHGGYARNEGRAHGSAGRGLAAHDAAMQQQRALQQQEWAHAQGGLPAGGGYGGAHGYNEYTPRKGEFDGPPQLHVPYSHVHLNPSFAEERHMAKMRHIESQQPMMLAYAKWLLNPMVKLLIIILYISPVVFAAFTVKTIKPGLPYRQTVPADSIIMNFLDDVDAFYDGSFPVKLVVVFEDTTSEDFGLVREVLDEMLQLPYITRVYPDWFLDYGRWVQAFGEPRGQPGLQSMCNLRRFLDDEEFSLADHPNSTLVEPLFSRLVEGQADGKRSAHRGRGLLAVAPAHGSTGGAVRGGGAGAMYSQSEGAALRLPAFGGQGEAGWETELAGLRRHLDGLARAQFMSGGGGSGGRRARRRLQEQQQQLAAAAAAAIAPEARRERAPAAMQGAGATEGAGGMPSWSALPALPEPGPEKRWHHRGAPPEGSPAAELAASQQAGRRHHHAHSGGDSSSAGGSSGPACENNEARFLSLSGGHPCDAAVGRCVSGVGHGVVAKLCPVTCGLCDDASRIAAASGANSTAVEQDLILGGKNYEPDVILAELVPGGCAVGGPGQAGAAQCANPNSCIIKAQRFVVAADLDQDMEQSFYVWEEMTKTFARVSERHGREINGYAYHIRFEFGYFDHKIIRMGLINLLAVVGVIAICTLIFLPTFISILAVFTVVCIDLQLLSVMSLAGLNFNSISCISLLIALGLAIDYSVHLGHAYHTAPFDTREAKVVHALLTIGASILNAGGSTLLGTLFLALSDSVVFRTFFIFMWGTIFLGLFSGLAFAPIVLSMIGPLEARVAAAPPQLSLPPMAQRSRNNSRESEYSDQPTPRYNGRR